MTKYQQIIRSAQNKINRQEHLINIAIVATITLTALYILARILVTLWT